MPIKNKIFMVKEYIYRCSIPLDINEEVSGLHYIWFETLHGVVMPMNIEGEDWSDYFVPEFEPKLAYDIQLAVQDYLDNGVDIVTEEDVDEQLEIMDMFMVSILTALSLGVTYGEIEIKDMEWHKITIPR